MIIGIAHGHDTGKLTPSVATTQRRRCVPEMTQGIPLVQKLKTDADFREAYLRDVAVGQFMASKDQETPVYTKLEKPTLIAATLFFAISIR
jgi:hypothetical protein